MPADGYWLPVHRGSLPELMDERPLIAAASVALRQTHEAFAFEPAREDTAMPRRAVSVGHARFADYRAPLHPIDAFVELAVAEAPCAARLVLSGEALDAGARWFMTKRPLGDSLAVCRFGAADARSALTYGRGGGAVLVVDARGARVRRGSAESSLAVLIVEALDAELFVAVGSVPCA